MALSMAAFTGGSWKGLLSLAVVLFVVLIPFFAFEELRRVFGEDITAAFLHPRHTVKQQRLTPHGSIESAPESAFTPIYLHLPKHFR